MNSLIVKSIFPLVDSGWIVGAGFCKLCNSSTASGECMSEQYSSNFGTTLFLAIFSGVTAETKYKI